MTKKKNNKCLYCYSEISKEDLDTPAAKYGYHTKCSKEFFGNDEPPVLDFTQDQIAEIAQDVIKSQKTVTGVQPKLSLGLEKGSASPGRFTIVGLWREYILKPQSEVYQNLPENEDLTMHLAQASKIQTVKHSLIRLKSGQLAYITRRIDREKDTKKHMEDMCQITDKLTENKYRGSYEQIAKAISKHSSNPGLDVINFYEVILFSFLTGNNDMHLKNFSLISESSQYHLCPAYDLVASELVVEEDDEELALTLNGKKRRIRLDDFRKAMEGSKIASKTIDNVFSRYQKLVLEWPSFVERSFLPDDSKTQYIDMIKEKAIQLKLS
ncbi:MAG: HipA domain-containing protein [Vicingaceae bacterium]